MFGSFAKNNACESSDIDIVIELTGPDIRRGFYLQGQDEISDTAALKNGQEKMLRKSDMLYTYIQ